MDYSNFHVLSATNQIFIRSEFDLVMEKVELSFFQMQKAIDLIDYHIAAALSQLNSIDDPPPQSIPESVASFDGPPDCRLFDDDATVGVNSALASSGDHIAPALSELISMDDPPPQSIFESILSFDGPLDSRLFDAGPVSSQKPSTILNVLKANLQDSIGSDYLDCLLIDLNEQFQRYLDILDGFFIPDISKIYGNISYNMQTINYVIATHFYQQGLFRIGDCFLREAKDSLPDLMKPPLEELNQIVESMKKKDITKAQSWVACNEQRLKDIGSDIELKLHYLRLMDLLMHGKKREAVLCAAKIIPFGSQHKAETQELMDGCPEGDFSNAVLIRSLERPGVATSMAVQFEEDFYSVLLNPNGPLTVTIGAGIIALPVLLTMIPPKLREQGNWIREELVIRSVDLDEQYWFHPVFLCPVTKKIATVNEALRPPCGHVLSSIGMRMLASTNSNSLNCPTCQVEITKDHRCLKLYF